MAVANFICFDCDYRYGQHSNELKPVSHCPKCGIESKWIGFKVGTILRGNSQFERYDCPITGKHITSRKAHDENLAIHGCRVVEKGENELAAKTKANADKVLELEVHTQIDADFARMTGDQKQQLANELTV